MTEKKRATFVAHLEWRICRHRRIRRRPLPLLKTTMPNEEYCDLTIEAQEAIDQWCRGEQCSYLDRPDVP